MLLSNTLRLPEVVFCASEYELGDQKMNIPESEFGYKSIKFCKSIHENRKFNKKTIKKTHFFNFLEE